MAISGKDAARQVIDALPDDASLDDIMYAMYVRMQIERGLQDEAAGNLIDHDDVKREINEWLRSAGRR
jgi:predicted transcriptional regulator